MLLDKKFARDFYAEWWDTFDDEGIPAFPCAMFFDTSAEATAAVRNARYQQVSLLRPVTIEALEGNLYG